jgi:hypothetical protein
VGLAFDDARTGDEEQFPVADFDASDFEGFDHSPHK